MDCWFMDTSSENGTDPCVVNQAGSSAIWIVFGALWSLAVLLCLNALREVRRVKPVQQKIEPRVLTLLLLCSICLTVLGFIKSPLPSANPIGKDLAATLLFGFGTSLLFTFIIIGPLNPAGTGITLFALQRKKRLFLFYSRFAPFLVVVAVIAAFLPLIGLAEPNRLAFVIPLTFGSFAFVLGVAVSVPVYAVNAMRNDFKTALRVKRHEVSESHKKGIETVVEATGKNDFALSCCAAFVMLVSLLIAIGIQFIMRACWILIPTILLIGWMWIIRYSLLSRLTTIRVIQRRYSRGVSITNYNAGKNSITVSASSSNQFSSQMRRYHPHHLLLSPVAGQRSTSSSLSASPNLLSPGSTGASAGQPRKKKGLFPHYQRGGSGKRFLTRVDEVENEGTIVSKYDVADWATSVVVHMPNTSSSFHTPPGSSHPQ